MQDRWYLLSIAQLLDTKLAEEKRMQCIPWLDEERQRKVRKLQNSRKQAECMGAGLVLQLAVREMLAQENGMLSKQGEEERKRIRQVSEILSELECFDNTGHSLEYTYGEWGKPYFRNLPYYFNLSHSGEYIFCVISTQEVGVDIQWEKPLKNDGLAQRYFSETEKERLSAISDSKEWQREFYRIWAEKEAYGKLTGRGIVGVLQAESECGELKCAVEMDGFDIKDYQIVICKQKNSERGN